MVSNDDKVSEALHLLGEAGRLDLLKDAEHEEREGRPMWRASVRVAAVVAMCSPPRKMKTETLQIVTGSAKDSHRQEVPLAMWQAPARALSLEPGKDIVAGKGPALASTGVDAGCGIEGRGERLLTGRDVVDIGVWTDMVTMVNKVLEKEGTQGKEDKSKKRIERGG
ncbi:hypothetical protein NDU88_006352 [Pleurodeles waltl]|uniref:Uncharacterized protein n=1 Tax=Pleurodeles waltl TaxID=8319 RepID=A0AAV7X1E9_PLEWA|nr:hypothetical protein NDU88_006352 [Pleurodeles waltl]